MPERHEDAGLDVLHVVSSTSFAGIERHVLGLAGAQAGLGHRIRVVCPSGARKLRAAAEREGLTVVPARGCGPDWARAVAALAVRDRPDVLHVHDGRAALAGAMWSAVGDGLFVRTQHFVHPASMGRGGWRQRISLSAHRAVNRRVDAYVAVSECALDEARRRGEVGSAHTAVIPPAITLPPETSVAAAVEHRTARSSPVVCFTGRLQAERHLDVLLRAVPLVLGVVPSCRFVLAGAGAAAEELQRLALELGVADAIAWPGWVEQPSSVMAGAHVYVNTWPHEAFGMAMAEAMAMALPVVAVNAGANPEMVEHAVTGLLVAPDDPSALAAALVTIASNLPAAAAIGQAARQRALDRYGAAATTRATGELYEQLWQRAG